MSAVRALTEKQIETLLRSLAEALSSGMGLLQYLENPAASAALPSGVARRLSVSLQQGATLATAMGRLPGVSRAEVALIAAGERTGRLPQALNSLAQARELRRKLRRNMLLGLAYPALMVCAAGCLLPLPLAVTQSVQAWLAWAIWPPLLVGGASLFALLVVPRLAPDSALRGLPARLGRRTPLLGRALERGAHGVFARTLGQCISAGLPMPVSLSTAILAADHPSLQRAEGDILGALDQGATLVEALQRADTFSPHFLGQVAQAELTGKLDEVLPRLAKQEEAVRRRAVIGATTALVVVVLLGVLGAVAYGIIQGANSYFEQLDETIKTQTR
jgi:general secretion pathway protein F